MLSFCQSDEIKRCFLTRSGGHFLFNHVQGSASQFCSSKHRLMYTLIRVKRLTLANKTESLKRGWSINWIAIHWFLMKNTQIDLNILTGWWTDSEKSNSNEKVVCRHGIRTKKSDYIVLMALASSYNSDSWITHATQNRYSCLLVRVYFLGQC